MVLSFPTFVTAPLLSHVLNDDNGNFSVAKAVASETDRQQHTHIVDIPRFSGYHKGFTIDRPTTLNIEADFETSLHILRDLVMAPRPRTTRLALVVEDDLYDVFITCVEFTNVVYRMSKYSYYRDSSPCIRFSTSLCKTSKTYIEDAYCTQPMGNKKIIYNINMPSRHAPTVKISENTYMSQQERFAIIRRMFHE